MLGNSYYDLPYLSDVFKVEVDPVIVSVGRYAPDSISHKLYVLGENPLAVTHHNIYLTWFNVLRILQSPTTHPITWLK